MIGYQAATVAPAYRQPSAAAVFPSINTQSPVSSIAESLGGSGVENCSFAKS